MEIVFLASQKAKLTLVVFTILIIQVSYTTYYCKNGNTINIEGEVNGSIHTLELGTSYYENSLDCRWKIDAGKGKRVQIIIKSSSLEYAPYYSSCYTRDSLNIYNGDSSNTENLVSICGNFNPYEVISTGQHVFLRFTTNHINAGNYKFGGVQLQFHIFDNATCPPDWHITSSGKCLKLMTQPTDGLQWTDAQQYCGYSHSNLAKCIEGKDCLDYGLNMSVPQFWIGMSDIIKEGLKAWLDGSVLHSNNMVDTASQNDLADCVIYDTTTEKFVFKSCSRTKYPFLCERNQMGETEIFKVPEASGEEPFAPVSLRWVITLSIGGGIAIIIIITVLYCYVKHKRRSKPQSTESHRSSGYSPANQSCQRNHSTSQNPRNNSANQDSGNTNEIPEPSAPPYSLHPDSQPPSYEVSQLQYSEDI